MLQLSIQYKNRDDFCEQLRSVKEQFVCEGYKDILFHLYSGVFDESFLVQAANDIWERFGTENIIGTMSAGEIQEGRLIEKSLLVSVLMFKCTSITVHRLGSVIGNEQETGRTVCRIADSTDELKAVELMLPGTRMRTMVLFEEAGKCGRDIRFFGGYAGGHSMASDEHFVFDHRGFYSDMIFMVCYAGRDFHIDVDKSVGWQTLGAAFKVTSADENRLISIDGAPAADLYRKYMQIGADESFAEETFEFPLMAEKDGEELLRHTISVEDDGTLDLAGYVEEGMDIYLCYGVPTDIVQKVDVRLEEISTFKPEAVLLYSCSVRKAFWESFVDIEMLPFQQIAYTTGFHTWGEVGRDYASGNIYEYNITLLSIAMREGECPQGEPVSVRVDDSALKGQASLIKRLTKLVYATTTELQHAYTNLSMMNTKLQTIADQDGLTALYNRRKIEQIITKSYESDTASGLIMLDIDHFKNINDTYGHAAGDEALITTADVMRSAVRQVNGAVIGRWGGEEFMILLPNVNAVQCCAIAEQLRQDIESHSFADVGQITASLGCIMLEKEVPLSELFIRVDNAVYSAKKAGRNKVIQN